MHHHVSPPCPDGPPSPRAVLWEGDAAVGAVPEAPRGLLPHRRWHPTVTFGGRCALGGAGQGDAVAGADGQNGSWRQQEVREDFG